MAQPHRAVPAAPPAYIGRFAPSPSGPLHAGSVVAALASYLDARAHDGLWLLRIEDIDPPRVEPGSDLTIRQQLRFLGLHWDGPPLYQSARVDRYQAVFDWLRAQGRIYGCGCTRREIIQAAHMLQTAQALQTTEALQTTQALQTTGARQAGPTRQTEPAHQASQRPSQALNTPADETPYPGTCRHGLPAGRQARAWRFRIDTTGTPPPQTLPEATNPLASADFVQPTDGNFPAAQERISNVGKAADLSNITFHDRWLGPQRQNPSLQCGDFILKRADGVWAYQLGVVVDDAESGVTDVVRGADLLSSTGRQILLLQALGAPVPRYLHLPLVMGDNGQKLSKQNGAPGVDTSGRMDAVDILNEAARALGLRQPGTRDVQRWLHEATAQWRARFCGSTINRQ
jgi:glutamyl-Q tRNA(asp) synthetase